MLDRLRSLVARYFERPATSVPPQKGPPTPVTFYASGKGLFTIDGNGNLKAVLDEPRDIDWNKALEAVSPPLGADPFEGERHADGPPPAPLNWSSWSTMARQEARPGWTFCRFAMRTGDETITQVFGIVSGALGIFTDQFHICGREGQFQLWSLCHLRSGTGIVLFDNPALACEAGEMINRLRLDLETDNVDQMRNINYPTIREAFAAINLYPAPFHAHKVVNGDFGAELIVLQRDYNAAQQRPEKLS